MKTRVLFPTLLAILASSGVAHADRDGRTGYSGDPGIRGGLSCEVCHSGGAVPSVDLTGPMTVTPGSTNTYTLTISGGQRVAGGLDVSATMGALAAFEAGTRLSAGEIVHTAPKAVDSSGSVAFSFNWTAPSSPGTAALYGAGLSSDGRDDEGGDEVDRMALMISVESAPPQNQPPVADPGGPYSGAVGATIGFDGSGSFDPDGTITSYTWDFGDGSGGAGSNPSHAYTIAGAYTVELTVTDDNGDTGRMTTMANINAAPPGNQPPSPSAGGPYSGTVGTAILFDGSGSRDPDGTITSYVWDFGDGSNGSGVNVDHSFATPGAYTVTLTVTDDQGASASATADAVVRDASTSSLLVLLKAPRRVRVGREDREVKIVVGVDTSSLPPGTTGCGTATLLMNGDVVGTQALCIEPRHHEDDDDDDHHGDDDEDDEDDEDDDHREKRHRSQRQMRVKTPHGVVAMTRPTEKSWTRVKFEVKLTSAAAPSVVWIAQADLAGRTGESAPVTTQVQVR